MIRRERPEAGHLDARRMQPIEREVVKSAADAAAPPPRHHEQRPRKAIADRDCSQSLVIAERDVLSILESPSAEIHSVLTA
jgi:hypothetical protein